MKTLIITSLLAGLIVMGCNNSSTNTDPGTAKTPETQAPKPAAQVAYDLGSIKKGDKAHCVVCSADGEEHGEEEAAETIDYEGKTYAFCSETEKAEFISEPAKYVKK